MSRRRDEPPLQAAKISMPLPSLRQVGAPLHQLVDFFTRSISSFQHSGSTFSVVCTLSPTPRDVPPCDALPSPAPPKARPRRLIVLDSSFNPPTRAHLRMAVSALQSSPYRDSSTSRLLLLLAINNADKAPKPASFEHRLAMMWAFAVDVQDALRSSATPTDLASTMDIALTTRPYFHEKSAVIAGSDFYSPTEEGCEGTETEQVILAGYDTLIRIFNPKYYSSPRAEEQETAQPEESPMQKALNPFLRRAKLRVSLRTDDEWGGAVEQRAYLEALVDGNGGGQREWGSRIELVEARKAGEEIVSSTYAREAAAKRDWAKLDRMVSPRVSAMIEELGLYKQ